MSKQKYSFKGLDKNYLGGEYFEMRECRRGEKKTRKRCRKAGIVTDKAELVAKAFGSGRPKMTNNQLRRFFSHARGLEKRLRFGVDFEQLKSEIERLITFVVDAKGKNKIPKSFEVFIRLRQATHRKKLKDLNWLTPEEFDRVRAGEVFRLSTSDEKLVSDPRVIFKNQIGRSTGTTGDEGQLYPFIEHLWQTVTIYVRIDGNEVEIVRQLFDDMKSMGYGKDKSSGYGEIAECE